MTTATCCGRTKTCLVCDAARGTRRHEERRAKHPATGHLDRSEPTAYTQRIRTVCVQYASLADLCEAIAGPHRILFSLGYSPRARGGLNGYRPSHADKRRTDPACLRLSSAAQAFAQALGRPWDLVFVHVDHDERLRQLRVRSRQVRHGQHLVLAARALGPALRRLRDRRTRLAHPSGRLLLPVGLPSGKRRLWLVHRHLRVRLPTDVRSDHQLCARGALHGRHLRLDVEQRRLAADRHCDRGRAHPCEPCRCQALCPRQ